MDARVELAGLMGLLPDEKYVLVHTAQPLTELRMDLKRQENSIIFSTRIVRSCLSRKS